MSFIGELYRDTMRAFEAVTNRLTHESDGVVVQDHRGGDAGVVSVPSHRAGEVAGDQRVETAAAAATGGALTAEDWMRRIEDDPEHGIQEFMDAFPSLPDKVRNDPSLNNFLQYQMQQVNRAYAFQANMQLAQHETMKAIISAIRV